MTDIHQKISSNIPAEFHMISGCADSQTSADVSNVEQFGLPDPQGKAGGACTSALLQVLYNEGRLSGGMSWVELLQRMRTELKNMGYEQIPQLSSSKMIRVREPMYIVPPGSTGRRRALLIGINYVGQQGQLSGCHDDLKNIRQYLLREQGFKKEEILVLMDDGWHHAPTRANITKAFKLITEYSEPGDDVFLHYSGHGSQVRDTSGDEASGFDSTLVPVDYRSAGQIVDDEILDILVKPMKAGVHVTALMDCCHSGTVFDLPYNFTSNDSEMGLNNRFKLSRLRDIAAAWFA